MPVSVEKDFRVKNGLQVVSTLTVLSTTAAFSTQTGALQVKGGAAVAGGMVVGGTLTATTFVGNFSGTITGNAASADKWSSARTINLGGDLSGSVSIDGTQNVTLTATIAADSVQLGTDTQGNYVATAFTNGYGLSGLSSQEGGIFTVTSNATSTNLPSTIVFRDANGNFNAGNPNTNSSNFSGINDAGGASSVAAANRALNRLQALCNMSNAAQPGFSTSKNPVRAHAIAFGYLFEPGNASQASTDAMNFLVNVQTIGKTLPAGATSIEDFKIIIGTATERIDKLRNAFERILQSGIQITLIQ